MASQLPNFLILGAMKAGTTSLAYWLGEHPDVFLAPGKELFFFNVPQRWELGVDWYRSQFAGSEGKIARGEATPGYLGHPQAAERIAATLPDVRLIALLRHPADRAYSQYWHNRATGTETRTFARMV
ncbi:MAG: sulfotransferase domain-containing protein, partial [Actinomycetota bacterium]